MKYFPIKTIVVLFIFIVLSDRSQAQPCTDTVWCNYRPAYVGVAVGLPELVTAYLSVQIFQGIYGEAALGKTMVSTIYAGSDWLTPHAGNFFKLGLNWRILKTPLTPTVALNTGRVYWKSNYHDPNNFSFIPPTSGNLSSFLIGGEYRYQSGLFVSMAVGKQFCKIQTETNKNYLSIQFYGGLTL